MLISSHPLQSLKSGWITLILIEEVQPQYDKKNLWIKFGDIICKVCVMSLKWRMKYFFIVCPKVLHRKLHSECFSVPSQCPSAFLSLFSFSFSRPSLWISTVFFSPRSFCCVYVFSVWTQRVGVISSKNLILLILVVLPSCFSSLLHSSVSSFLSSSATHILLSILSNLYQVVDKDTLSSFQTCSFFV